MGEMQYSEETKRDPDHFPIPTITKEREIGIKVCFQQVCRLWVETKDLHTSQAGKVCNSFSGISRG